MKIRVSLLAGLLALSFCHVASAELLVAVDLDPSTDTIDSNRTVMIGDEFDVDIKIRLDANDTLLGYNYSARFNTDVLDVVSWSQVRPPNWIVLATPLLEDPAGSDDAVLGSGGYGQFSGIEGIANFGDPALSGPDMFSTLRVTFKAVAPFSGIVFNPQKLNNGVESFFDENALEITPVFQAGNLTVVPEPSSLVLLGALPTGCFGVGMFVQRRRKSS